MNLTVRLGLEHRWAIICVLVDEEGLRKRQKRGRGVYIEHFCQPTANYSNRLT